MSPKNELVPASEPQRMALPSGHVVEAEAHEGGERLRVRAASGEVLVTMELTERGPVLRLSAAALEVTAGALSLDCDDLRVRARGGISMSAEEVALEARAGNLDLRANDDVDVRGERIRLNCDDAPMPRTWEEFASRPALPGAGRRGE
jgi:hypothetical protein